MVFVITLVQFTYLVTAVAFVVLGDSLISVPTSWADRVLLAEHQIIFRIVIAGLGYTLIAWIFRMWSSNVAKETALSTARQTDTYTASLLAESEASFNLAIFLNRLAPIEGTWRWFRGIVPDDTVILSRAIKSLRFQQNFEGEVDALGCENCYSHTEREKRLLNLLRNDRLLSGNIPSDALRRLLMFVRDHAREKIERLSHDLKENEDLLSKISEWLHAFQQAGISPPDSLVAEFALASSKLEEARHSLKRLHKRLIEAMETSRQLHSYREGYRKEALGEKLVDRLREIVLFPGPSFPG